MAKTTLQSLKKVPGIQGLYRHENGSYYAKKKLKGGSKKVAALVTADGENIKDKDTAKKALAVWLETIDSPASIPRDMTVAELWKKFLAQKAGQAASTFKKYQWVKQCIDVDFPNLWKTRVADVKPSQLAEFFASRRTMKASAFNELTMHVKNLFEVAVGDLIIPTNPYRKVQKEVVRKKNKRKPDEVPTIEQCEKIVAHVRAQEFADTASKSADMLSLMHLAALGQAEILALDWKDIDWTEEHISIIRVKTGEYFQIPIYPHLRPFLVDLHERQGKPTAGKLVSILSPKQALYNACKRLGLPSYSPRDFRKARIVWMLRKGVAAETLADWQGHQDNGVLIRRVYSWVEDEERKAHQKAQLEKLAA